MPRLRRIVLPETAMHVRSRGNNKQMIFHSDQDKSVYYNLLAKFMEENGINIFHYCIMGNHLHLILWILQNTRLARFMKQVNGSYAIYYKKTYNYVGHLFQGRYKSNIIQNDSHLLQCGKYIELNPVRAEIVDAPEDYKFSSYNYYAYGKPDPIVTPSPAYLGLMKTAKKRREAYQEFVVQPEVINKEKLSSHPMIGSENFILEYLERLKK